MRTSEKHKSPKIITANQPNQIKDYIKESKLQKAIAKEISELPLAITNTYTKEEKFCFSSSLIDCTKTDLDLLWETYQELGFVLHLFHTKGERIGRFKFKLTENEKAENEKSKRP